MLKKNNNNNRNNQTKINRRNTTKFITFNQQKLKQTCDH